MAEDCIHEAVEAASEERLNAAEDQRKEGFYWGPDYQIEDDSKNDENTSDNAEDSSEDWKSPCEKSVLIIGGLELFDSNVEEIGDNEDERDPEPNCDD